MNSGKWSISSALGRSRATRRLRTDFSQEARISSRWSRRKSESRRGSAWVPDSAMRERTHPCEFTTENRVRACSSADRKELLRRLLRALVQLVDALPAPDGGSEQPPLVRVVQAQ